jgi:SAM-dependent methyltransferase
VRAESALHTAEEFAAAYGDRSWEFYRPLLAALVEFSPPGLVLDVGAGTGLFVECCAKFGLTCVGLEGSMAGAAAARGRGLPMVLSRLEDPLPFADRRFATVMCNQVIEHVHGDTAARLLAEARRVLLPGGVLFIQSPSPRDPVQRAEPGHINLYLPSRLRREVLRAGFQIVAERNGPLRPLGRGRLRDLAFLALLRLTGWSDLLSASANIVARRPLDP